MTRQQEWKAGVPLSDLEYYSFKETYKFLCHLTDPQKYPNIPKSIRERAKKCLDYFPVKKTLEDLDSGVTFYNPQ